jgi:tetratricopeptide (TPR) repeat protein
MILLLLVSIQLNPPEIEHLIKSGLEYSYVEQFDSAQYYFNQVKEKYPENPAGYFFSAALTQLKMMDECRFMDEDKYYGLIRKTIELSQTLLDEESNIWARFYLANAYIYQAVYKGFRKDYFETFKLGMKGGKMMQAVVQDDSTFFDAYLAAGTFEYFWARASRYLPFLNLGGGDVDGAIAKLNIAAEKSIYSGPTARNSLVFIYGEEGRFVLAREIVDNLLVEYPTSRTFMWNKAELEFKSKEYRMAASVFHDLYERYDAHNEKNYANLAQCRLYIGKCFVELGEKDNARANLKEVIRLKEHSDSYPQINGYCREAYAILNRLL